MYIKIFDSSKKPIIDGVVTTTTNLSGTTGIGERLASDIKFDKDLLIEKIKKEWLLLNIGQEYVLYNNDTLALWKIEDTCSTISTVYIQCSDCPID
jgi:hypothetical protein